MIKSTKIEDAEFVMSKDELTYAEVIEDFEEASSIHILTYNISKDKSDLLKALKKCDEDTEICIVSNISGRWEKYFGEYYKSKARKNISLYKSKLSPAKIAEKAEVYFCFSNHAKIIMTNNIAYIGSSNFSEESADNFESGFISRDAEFIEFLEEEIFPWIIESSSEYKTDEEILFFELAIRKSIAMFEEMHEEYLQTFYLLADHRGIERWYYNTTDPILSVKEMEKTEEICNQYVDLLKNVNKIFNMRAFSEEGIDNLDDVIEKAENIIGNIKTLFGGNIEELAKYDGQDIIDEYINDHYADAYDENLEYYVDKAMDIANETFAELANDAQEEADDLLEEIKNLGEVSKKVLILFKKLPLEKIKIDNTDSGI